jgi:hypothetical protein
MRTLIQAMAAAAALTAASAANATVTLGSTGQLAGTSSSVISSVTDNANVPNKVTFDTNNAAAGTSTSFFDFLESYNSTGVFSVTTSTMPSSSVTLLNVLTGQTLSLFPADTGTYGGSAGSNTGSSFALNLTADLAANTWYRFVYSANMATPGDVSGTANFYARSAVPEPATWGMMLLGFLGMGMVMRRRPRPAFAQVA